MSPPSSEEALSQQYSPRSGTQISLTVPGLHNVLQTGAGASKYQAQTPASVDSSFSPSYSSSNTSFPGNGSFASLPNYEPLIARPSFICSPNYRGDPYNPNNQSANIPDEENCALWILGLPAAVTYTALLGAIRGVGRVYATVINLPTDSHSTCAAKIVFFKRSHAEALMFRANVGKFVVMGEQIRNVRWNNIKSAAYSGPGQSRVIRITGPADMIKFTLFKELFDSRFIYQLESWREIPHPALNMVSHEWHFASLRRQAETAKQIVEQELAGTFMVTWSVDPCAFP